MRLDKIRSSFGHFAGYVGFLSFEMAVFGFLLANWNQMRSKVNYFTPWIMNETYDAGDFGTTT